MRPLFPDRLDPATYADDDETVGIFESDPDEADSLWLSARLFGRLVGVAGAYGLHLLPHLGGSSPVELNRQQCEALLDELAFVTGILNDPLAASVVGAVADYIVARMRRPEGFRAVTFEGE